MHATQTNKEAIKLIPRSVLFGNPERIGPQISHDGTQLAYIAPHMVCLIFGCVHLQVMMIVLLLKILIVGIREYIWLFDGKHLIYSQDREWR